MIDCAGRYKEEEGKRDRGGYRPIWAYPVKCFLKYPTYPLLFYVVTKSLQIGVSQS